MSAPAADGLVRTWRGKMRAGLVFLVAGYVLSQFYRAFLAVLAPALQADIGAGPADLALSSGLLFATFALMQLPVGAALDRYGPRWTTAILLAFGAAGGAVIFALAQGPWAVHLAMALIGIGCSPVLMAAYFLFARVWPAAMFGTLAGAMIGVGSLGNIAGTAPLAWLAAAAGWRATLAGLAAVTLLVAVGIVAFLRDPLRAAAAPDAGGSDAADGIGALLRLRALWPILPLMTVAYAPAAAVRGLWAGPYMGAVFGADAAGIGRATLIMGLAMVAGNFAYGAADRLFGSARRAVLAGTAMTALCLAALAAFPAAGAGVATLLLALLGFFGQSFPALMTHGRGFLPAHLIGRGVTLLNMFAIGGAGILQFLSGRVHATAAAGSPANGFSAIFLFFLIPLVAGLALYLFSRDAGSGEPLS